MDETRSVQLENSLVRLVNVHPAARCEGAACPIHHRTAHHMRAFPQHYRMDRRIMERICPHGVGHPDPDDPTTDTVHGCDGCCHPPDATYEVEPSYTMNLPETVPVWMLWRLFWLEVSEFIHAGEDYFGPYLFSAIANDEIVFDKKATR